MRVLSSLFTTNHTTGHTTNPSKLPSRVNHKLQATCSSSGSNFRHFHSSGKTSPHPAQPFSFEVKVFHKKINLLLHGGLMGGGDQIKHQTDKARIFTPALLEQAQQFLLLSRLSLR